MVITFKKIVKCFMPHGFVLLIRKIKLYEKLGSDKKVFGDKYPDKTFYVIRRDPPGSGLFSNYHWVLGHVLYAIDRHYTPVVDMENYKTYYNEETAIDGTYNAWEYYFKQPSEYTLNDVYHSKNVILADANYYFHDKIPFPYSKKHIHKFNLFINKYLQFNEKTKNYIEVQSEKYFNSRKNILGVLYRGTDYQPDCSPKGHFIPASLDEIITKTKELYNEWNMEWVYLETEEDMAIKEFQKDFDDVLITTVHPRIVNYDKTMGGVPSIGFGRKNDKFLNGLDYIADTVLLSKCDALIASKNGGSMAAIELNGNRYKHKYIFEKGVY
jgi:hypothetical protein